MKLDHPEMSDRYVSALRLHLGGRSTDSGLKARSLGRWAVAKGVATSELALVHVRAMASLERASSSEERRPRAAGRAEEFFILALRPLQAAQRAALRSNGELQRRNEALRLHSAALVTGNRRLQREVIRRKAGEVIILEGKEQYQKLFLESQVMQKKLRQLTRQIISAQEEERKEISRELHDEVVQTLVGINVELSALSKGADSGLHRLKAKIARTQRIVENSVNTVHRFARELRPAVLDDLGLIPALHAFSKSLAARKKLKIRLTAFAGVETLVSMKRTVLFRVAQEALTNVARHADATQIRINISEVSGAILMEIGDNGKSFEVEKTMAAINHKRLGLVGMKERIEMVGGNLTIISVAGQGTTVRAEIPFSPEKL